MSDETTNASNSEGEESNNDVTNNKENISELDKLKASNDEVEKELIRGRKLREESQKLEAEKRRGGKTNAGQAQITPKERENEEAKKEAQGIVDAFR